MEHYINAGLLLIIILGIIAIVERIRTWKDLNAKDVYYPHSP